MMTIIRSTAAERFFLEGAIDFFFLEVFVRWRKEWASRGRWMIEWAEVWQYIYNHMHRVFRRRSINIWIYDHITLVFSNRSTRVPKHVRNQQCLIYSRPSTRLLSAFAEQVLHLMWTDRQKLAEPVTKYYLLICYKIEKHCYSRFSR